MFDRLPELLRRLRLDQDLTQEELARTAEVSVSQVSRIEAGHQGPQLDTLSRLLQALGVASFDDFSRLYRNLKHELDHPGQQPDELSADVQAEQAGTELAARIRPLLADLPADLSGAQLDFPRYVVYVMPKAR